ncbi:phage DNA ejection protein [Klebsiella aerogenes]|uniref:phage DNA ejection protein n=1 Tax=Klebsiella aerogenes TaxID=548 RepID=UPI0007B34609|nr:phage DNA ejection protein [Klebsiella aerogenes]KZR10493.1 hypothetical protein A3N54_05835 [Klebsiella aerogenes]
MVTWNQGINSGGFLAGIGTNNDNAPKASDADTALAYIRDNNDRERSGQNNLGLQAVLGATNVLQGLKQYDEQQTAQAFQKDYASAMQSGDRQQVRDLMTKYPGQMEKIQSGMKWADDDQRSTVGNLAASARLASSSPEAMGDWLKSNAADLQRVGLSPQDIAQTYQQNPQQFGEFADHLGMAALGPAEYFAAQDKIVGQALNRDKLNETIRSNQAGEALQQRGQDITVRGQNISASNSAADRQIRLLQLKQDALVKQAASEANDLKRQELQQKIDANQQVMQEKQQQKKMSLDYAAEAASLAREIASDSSLGDITGSISSRVPTFYDSSQDLINKANRLQSLLTQDNLKLMNGVLTDRDITFLGNIASGLNITENGIKGSKDGVQKRLNAIASKLDDKLSASGYSPQQKQLSDDELIGKYAGGK